MTTAVSNVVVCGAPRSGTSMLANLLADGGLTTADCLIPASTSNPHGFGEDIRVNRLNDSILERMEPVPGTPDLPRSLWWLRAYAEPAAEHHRMDIASAAATIPRSPFVLKDPRFAHTLPAWRPLLGDVITLVTVRPASEVATSLARMAAREAEFFRGWCGDDDSVRAVTVPLWNSTYRSALTWADESTYFVCNDDVADPTISEAIGDLIGVALTSSTVDSTLSDSRPMSGVHTDLDVGASVAHRIAADRRRLLGPVGMKEHRYGYPTS